MDYHGFTGESAGTLNALLIVAFTRCVVATSLDLRTNLLTSFGETKALDESDMYVLNAIKNGILKYVEINGVPRHDDITFCWKEVVKLGMADDDDDAQKKRDP